MKEENWDAVIATDLKSVFLTTKAAAAMMMRKKNGAETTSFTVHPSYLLTGINCQTITTLKI